MRPARKPIVKQNRRVKAASSRPPHILVVAGEVSGDEHSAAVVKEVLKLRPESKVFGMGGASLRAAGMDTTVDSEEYASVMGLTEVLGSLPKIRQAYKQILDAVDTHTPDVAMLTDYAEFNMLLAKALRKRGVPVVFFISPQIWAWRRGRIKAIKRNVKKVLPIFPFEESFYHKHGVEAEYIGHPFLDRAELEIDAAEFLRSVGARPDSPTIALLPGSRRAEIKRLLPPMLEAVKRLQITRPGLQAILPVASSIDVSWVKELIGSNANVKIVRGQARECLRSATVAVVASGTATVEAALAQVPFFVVYKLSPLTYSLARRLVRGVSKVAMANLIAGKALVEELLQDEVSGERIAEELERLLGDSAKRQRLSEELSLVRRRLETGLSPENTGPERAARTILEFLPETTKNAGQL